MEGGSRGIGGGSFSWLFSLLAHFSQESVLLDTAVSHPPEGDMLKTQRAVQGMGPTDSPGAKFSERLPSSQPLWMST